MAGPQRKTDGGEVYPPRRVSINLVVPGRLEGGEFKYRIHALHHSVSAVYLFFVFFFNRSSYEGPKGAGGSSFWLSRIN